MTQYSVCVCIAKQFCKGPRCQIGTLDPIQSLNTKKKKGSHLTLHIATLALILSNCVGFIFMSICSICVSNQMKLKSQKPSKDQTLKWRNRSSVLFFFLILLFPPLEFHVVIWVVIWATEPSNQTDKTINGVNKKLIDRQKIWLTNTFFFPAGRKDSKYSWAQSSRNTSY